jgi:hypothetical protein
VIGIAHYVERYGKEAERESVEREVRDWVNTIIGDLDAKGRGT